MPTLPRTEHALARSLAETADPREALARALAVIGDRLGWLVGTVWEPPADRPEALRCVESWTAPGTDAAEFIATCEATALAPGEGLPGRVWASGAPAWLPDVLADENFPRRVAAQRAGLRAAFCFPLRSAEGTSGAIEFFAGEVLDADEELLATMSTMGDQIGQAIERRRDADRLRAQEARHEAMLNAALDCVVTIDHEGRVIDFNPAAERTFGHDASTACGRDMADLLVPPSLRERHRAAFARYLQTEQPTVLDRRIEITGMRADGSEFPVELTITRIDVPGPPTFAGYLRDITERKAALAELRASRARIVAAGDAARRRLERDLHDGAQQRLVEVALDLRMARARLETDPRQAAELVDQALEDLSAAARELRELARGIHPAALTEGGLRPALEALAGRCSTPVKLTAPDQRFPPAAESTAYFTIAEALTNAARYAQATTIEVSVQAVNGGLSLRVRDDGQGGATIDGGSGLRGLQDRIAALDGTLDVTSPPGAGTELRAEIPCA